MAGDWIKMRVWLRKDPRVASMADFLASDRGFMFFLTDAVGQSCKATAYEHVTSDVTRAITVVSLLEIWGVARERGDRVGDDLVLKHCDLDNLDTICGTPGMGEAMEYVEWAIQEDLEDRKGRSVSSVRFPNFFAENESPDDRYKKQHAEAQARYRAKQQAKSDISVDGSSDITRDITVTPREEKRREERNTPPTPKGGLPEGFARFWSCWPKSDRKGSRGECLKAWGKADAEAVADAVIAHVECMKASLLWTKDGGQYIPAPLVYLNQRRWDGADESATVGEQQRGFV